MTISDEDLRLAVGAALPNRTDEQVAIIIGQWRGYERSGNHTVDTFKVACAYRGILAERGRVG